MGRFTMTLAAAVYLLTYKTDPRTRELTHNLDIEIHLTQRSAFPFTSADVFRGVSHFSLATIFPNTII